ncbi:MAG: metal ABC transporter substrate-binding protein [Bacteroidota bacterium]
MIRRSLLLVLLAIVLSSCGGIPASDTGKASPVILTSTPILADVARNIAGDRLQVESLLPTGSDPHSYQPTPRDAAKVSDSKLIVVNGAGYEQFLKSLLGNAGGRTTVVEASAGVHPQEEAGAVDPHMWMDPNNMIVYVENIRAALTRLDPAGEAVYKSNAESYISQLQSLDSWIQEQVRQIPPEKRLLITNHEALGYFASRYGFTVSGTVLRSFSSDASPSAQQLATLIDEVRSSGAPAIFLDAADNDTFARQIAQETGVKVITGLHLESLTDGPPAATYIDMMKDDVTQIVNALK